VGILDQGCQCQTCSEHTKQNLKLARQKWNHDIREVVFKPYHHSCGDGCCDEYGTNVYVNGFDLNCDGEDAEQVISALIEFLNIENVSVERVYEDES
jgi:hypothetical protein